MLEAIYIFALLCTLVLIAVFNHVVDVNKTAKKSMVLLMSSGFFWGLLRYIAGITNEGASKTFFELSLVVTVFSPIFFLRFVSSFPARDKIFEGMKSAATYSAATLIILSLVLGGAVKEIEKDSFSIDVTDYGLGYLAFFIYQFTLFSLGFALLYRKYKSTSNQYNRNIIRDLFVAVGSIFVTSVLIGITLDLVLDETNKYMSLIEFPVTIIATAFFVQSAILNLKRANQDLSSKLHMNMEVINILSHQLRTPLTTVANYSAILMNNTLGNLNEKQARAIKQIEYSSFRMTKILNEFLSTSQLTSSSLKLQLEVVDLTILLNNIVKHYNRLKPESDGNIRLSTSKTPLYIYVDKTKVSEVISNLIDNALSYNKGGNRINIRLEKSYSNCRLQIRDHGIGVPESYKAQIFEKFARAQNASKYRPNGTGLGLFFVRKVIEAHGGEIIFKSKEGVGSTFGFTLPLAEPTP